MIRLSVLTIMLLVAAAILTEANASEDGIWSGLIIPVARGNCPADKRKVVGELRNGVFSVTLVDGWETTHQISAEISSNGRMLSDSFQWPSYRNGWAQSPNPTENQVVGIMKANSFQGIVFAVSGGRNCDSEIYMLEGAGHTREFRIKEGIRKSAGDVLAFDFIYHRFAPSRQNSSLTTQNTGFDQASENGEPVDAPMGIRVKLRIVNDLLESGLITAEEAAHKRKTLLDEF